MKITNDILMLSRDSFRNEVFKRDNKQCVICKEPAVDAHHIMERKLFSNGGYFIDNGASLCKKHHLEAEATILDIDTIREAAGIKNIILPEHLYIDVEYDKWGNEILRSGERIKGELYDDESVQKILPKNISFTNRVKYPRTYHLPWSPGMNRDDRMMTDAKIFKDQEVVVVEKLDGENTTWYNDYMHSRSITSSSHPSRNWVKNLWAQKAYNIPEDWRVCGENMFAKHSVHYTKENENILDSYFYMFSIWDDKNVCLSWKETKEWAELLEIKLVPIFYEGIWDMDVIQELNNKMEKSKNRIEGYVVRLCREYHYSEFRKVCGKYVRSNHVQNNHGHWSQRKIIKNEIE